MSPDDFKKWRNTLKLTQVEASEMLGISRVTVQNWENSTTRIPMAIEAACEMFHRRWKMRPEYGPVTLTHLDAPLWQSPYGPTVIPKLSKELYPNNSAAVERACQLRGQPGIYSLLVSDESSDIVWNSIQLEQECERRSSTRKSARNSRAT
jgi:DNA-binding XRE family transcriptional regulator